MIPEPDPTRMSRRLSQSYTNVRSNGWTPETWCLPRGPTWIETERAARHLVRVRVAVHAFGCGPGISGAGRFYCTCEHGCQLIDVLISIRG